MNNRICRYRPATIAGWVDAEPNTPLAELAARRGIDLDVFKARLETGRRERMIDNKFPFTLGQPAGLKGDALITGDLHAPFISHKWVERVAAVARKGLAEPRQLVIVGDFANMDKWSAYPHIVNPPKWADERDALRDVTSYWLDTFDQILYLMGNHDRRLQKATQGAFDDTDIIGMINSNKNRVKSSNYGWCTLESGKEMYRPTHPKNYSVNELVVADQLALKYQMHIIGFHEHHVAQGWDRFKRYMVINGGCLAEYNKFAYATLDDSKGAGMANGFVMVKGGHPTVFADEPWTDWSQWV